MSDLFATALQYSNAVANFLYKDCVLAVHSIFDHSMNLIKEDRLIHLTPIEKGITPYSIVFRAQDFEQIKKKIYQNAKGTFNNKTQMISIGDQEIISLKNAAIYDPLLHVCTNNHTLLKENTTLLSQVCTLNPQWQFGILDSSFEIAKEKLINDLQRGCDEPIDIDYWIGRGKGLTPSGDDFIIGMMAFLTLMGKTKYRNRILNEARLKEKKDQTTRISYEFLYYGSKGMYSVDLNELMDYLTRKDQTMIIKGVYRLCSLGHTSGFDTLCGILTACEMLQ